MSKRSWVRSSDQSPLCPYRRR